MLRAADFYYSLEFDKLLVWYHDDKGKKAFAAASKTKKKSFVLIRCVVVDNLDEKQHTRPTSQEDSDIRGSTITTYIQFICREKVFKSTSFYVMFILVDS
jgi:hypothetical protein